MASRETLDKLKQILVTKLKVDRKPEKIGDNELLFKGGLELDSIDSLEIIIAVEKVFGVRMPDEDLKEPEKIFKSVGTLADYIDKLISKK